MHTLQPHVSALGVNSQQSEGARIRGFGARLSKRPRSAQECLDASHQFARAEWLCHVVIGTHRESDQGVDLITASGEHDHVGIGESSELPADLDTVKARQPEVENHDVRVDFSRQTYGLQSIVDNRDLEPVSFEVTTKQLSHRRLVLDDHRAKSGVLGHGAIVTGRRTTMASERATEALLQRTFTRPPRLASGSGRTVE